jgi:hypothetical protein
MLLWTTDTSIHSPEHVLNGMYVYYANIGVQIYRYTSLLGSYGKWKVKPLWGWRINFIFHSAQYWDSMF